MFHYRCIECKNMSEIEVQKTARLFTQNCGIWSPHAENVNPRLKGNIKMSVDMIKRSIINKPD